MQKLKCPSCNSNLKLSIGYTGCDWNSKKGEGEGSGYGWEVSLECTNEDCRNMYTIGMMKECFHLAEMKDELKCVE